MQEMVGKPESTKLDGDVAGLLFEHTDNFVCTLDLDGRFTSVNPAGERISGYPASELIGRFATDLVAPEVREDAVGGFRRRLAAGDEAITVETVLLRRDRGRVPISVSSILLMEAGTPTGVLGIIHDLSERRRTKAALDRSEQQFRGSFESAAIGMALVSVDGRYLEVNHALCDFLGYDADALASLTFQELTHPDDLELDLDYTRRMLAGELPSYHLEKRYLHSSGREVWGHLSVSLVRDAAGEPLYFVSQVQDIDARKRAVDELRRREAQLEEAQQLAKMGSWEWRSATGEVAMSEELLRLYGLGAGTSVTLDLLTELVHPEDRDKLARAAERPLPEGEVSELEFRIVLPGQVGRWLHSRAETIVEDGVAVGRRGITQDVTERKEAEERFLAAERRYRRLVEQLPLAMYIRPLDMDKPNIYVSPQVEPMLGHPAQAWLSDPGLLARIVHPDDRARVLAEGRRVRSGGPPVEDEYRYVRPDGGIVWVQDVTHLVHDADGEPLYVQGFLRDVTSSKLTEAERDRLRDELHHAQRLDAIGRLAGGVAHDFNNMLTAIKGYAELLTAKLDPSTDAHADAVRIMRAAEQASDLPRHLLAFGRKQVLEPAMIDLNEIVGSIGGLLDHVISERISVRIDRRADAPLTFADRSQLEHALVNLALNASDAMPDGGVLTVSTENVTIGDAEAMERDAAAGAYVVVRVSDTGTGMDEETRTRAFEPFFTTKEQTEGSGLGLSRVYGTVTQSGGFVVLETELGKGSSFALHLPAAKAPARRMPTILLAEDEEIVRDLTGEILTSAGYGVLTATDGAEALSMYREQKHAIAGVVTDIVMPNLGGRELARRIREDDSEIPIVFISGHHDETPESLQLGDGAALLQKPFSLAALLETVESLVGAEPREQPAVIETGARLPELTPREREVLSLVADGLTNDKVAAELAISPETVQSHVRHAMVKLDAETRTEAVATALRHALIS